MLRIRLPLFFLSLGRGGFDFSSFSLLLHEALSSFCTFLPIESTRPPRFLIRVSSEFPREFSLTLLFFLLSNLALIFLVPLRPPCGCLVSFLSSRVFP